MGSGILQSSHTSSGKEQTRNTNNVRRDTENKASLVCKYANLAFKMPSVNTELKAVQVIGVFLGS